LIAPEVGEAGRGAQLEHFCSLSVRNGERLSVAVLGGGFNPLR
jgi:hypothetical protein